MITIGEGITGFMQENDTHLHRAFAKFDNRARLLKFYGLQMFVEYNMRKSFLEKSFTKYDGETGPRPFSKKSKLVNL